MTNELQGDIEKLEKKINEEPNKINDNDEEFYALQHSIIRQIIIKIQGDNTEIKVAIEKLEKKINEEPNNINEEDFYLLKTRIIKRLNYFRDQHDNQYSFNRECGQIDIHKCRLLYLRDNFYNNKEELCKIHNEKQKDINKLNENIQLKEREFMDAQKKATDEHKKDIKTDQDKINKLEG